MERDMSEPTTKTANRVLWTIQVILTLLYLFTGATKLILPLGKLCTGDTCVRIGRRVM
jgi:hypothetical protein